MFFHSSFCAHCHQITQPNDFSCDICGTLCVRKYLTKNESHRPNRLGVMTIWLVHPKVEKIWSWLMIIMKTMTIMLTNGVTNSFGLCSFIQPFIHSFIFSFIISSIHPFIHSLFPSFIHSLVSSLFLYLRFWSVLENLPIRPSVCLSFYPSLSVRPSTILSIPPSIHSHVCLSVNRLFRAKFVTMYIQIFW